MEQEKNVFTGTVSPLVKNSINNVLAVEMEIIFFRKKEEEKIILNVNDDPK